MQQRLFSTSEDNISTVGYNISTMGVASALWRLFPTSRVASILWCLFSAAEYPPKLWFYAPQVFTVVENRRISTHSGLTKNGTISNIFLRFHSIGTLKSVLIFDLTVSSSQIYDRIISRGLNSTYFVDQWKFKFHLFWWTSETIWAVFDHCRLMLSPDMLNNLPFATIITYNIPRAYLLNR